MLTVNKGVIIRDVTSISVQKVTEVKVVRDVMLALFGLHFVEVWLPSNASENHGHEPLCIEGLRCREAFALRAAIQRSFGIMNDSEKASKPGTV